MTSVIVLDISGIVRRERRVSDRYIDIAGIITRQMGIRRITVCERADAAKYKIIHAIIPDISGIVRRERRVSDRYIDIVEIITRQTVTRRKSSSIYDMAGTAKSKMTSAIVPAISGIVRRERRVSDRYIDIADVVTRQMGTRRITAKVARFERANIVKYKITDAAVPAISGIVRRERRVSDRYIDIVDIITRQTVTRTKASMNESEDGVQGVCAYACCTHASVGLC